MAQAMASMNPDMGGMGKLFGASGVNQPGAGAKQWNPVASPMQPTVAQGSSSPNMTPPSPSQAFMPGAMPPSFGGSGSMNPYDPNADKNRALAMLFKGY